MKEELLTRTECSIMRGIAIIGIVLHNYCHFMGFAVKENEYTFDASKPQMLLNRLMSPDGNLFVHLLSFFGHYGVPVFLFMSGYGLVMKYEREGTPSVPTGRFIGYHYMKLLRLMFLGYIAFMVVSYAHPHGYHGYDFGRIVAQLFMFINFLPDPDHIIKPGPYWFFSLMLQLYVVYRLFLYRAKSSLIVGMIVICWLVEELCMQDFDSMNRVRYNFFGGMLPFGLGLLYARHGQRPEKAMAWTILLVSIGMVFCLGFWFQGWLWCPLFVVTGAAAGAMLIPKKLSQPLVWVGNVSAAMFVVHPIMREIIIPMSFRGDVYCGILVYVISTVLLSWAFHSLIRLIPSPRLK